ncbi:M15 family metallopeptidase [Nocardioides pakistanensis]
MARSPRPAVVVCTLLAVVAAGCALPGSGAVEMSSVAAGPSALADRNGLNDPAVAATAPGRLVGGVESADLLVTGRDTLPAGTLRRITATEGVRATLVVAMAAAPVAGRMVTLAAADPSSYRRFTPEVAARADAVWQRVAEGDLAASPELVEELGLPLGGELPIGSGTGASLRVGAHATLSPGVDAVVNPVRGSQLGMVPGNAVLIAVDGDTSSVEQALGRRLGRRVTVTRLAAEVPSSGTQTASLTGGSVADAVGSFRYRWFDDGTVEPDPAWAAANLRTETVPILGTVTCHRVMLPQLRGALQEVVDVGLADRIDPGDFGGCYAPRFIAGDPAKGLSLHTWGIAVDLNVQGNLRGTTGEIDRRVVEVFKRWGFAWGGDWSYTDPMHFELAALVEPR